jgi:hypothetical protein
VLRFTPLLWIASSWNSEGDSKKKTRTDAGWAFTPVRELLFRS